MLGVWTVGKMPQALGDTICDLANGGNGRGYCEQPESICGFLLLLVCCCSGPDTAPRIRHVGNGPVLQQAIAGMLSSTLTQSRSLLLCCASGERYRWWSPVCGVALEQTFTI